MEQQPGAPGPLNLHRKIFHPNKCTSIQTKGKGIVRWHGAVSTNLPNQYVLVPNRETSSDSDSGSFTISGEKKRSLGQRMKALMRKVLHPRVKEGKLVKVPSFVSSLRESPVRFQKQHLPRETEKRSGKRMSQAAILQLDVNVVEAETQQVTADNLIVRSKKTSRRVSVTSLPTGLQKGSYSSRKRHFALMRRKKKAVEKVKQQSEYTIGSLQMQVDDLIETIADKSSQLLAQRHEELLKCETMSDEILQSSKQFQRVSRKSRQKYKFKNVCFPCICCCY